MSVTTLYIHPALTDQAGQCRIYALEGALVRQARDHYRLFPELWREVGIMNSRGKLVCFEGPDFQRQDLVDSQPLMAGTTFSYDEQGVAP